MINLITGVPGSGKTVQAMSFMLSLLEEGRPLYVHGIPNLKIKHQIVVCSSPTCEICPQAPIAPNPLVEPDTGCFDFQTQQYEIDKRNYESALISYNSLLEKHNQQLKAEDWHVWAPDGAVIFYDEVQNVYRPRSSSSKVPPSVAAFETHRHKGLDFYLVTQSPLLFDSNIRRLVGKHIHLRPTWAGRYQYEYPECNDNPKNVSQGIKSKYKLNKKVFKLFKSSSLHTKQTKKIPPALYILVGCFVAAILIGFRINNRISTLSAPKPTEITQRKSNKQRAKSLPIQTAVYQDDKEIYQSYEDESLTRTHVISWSTNGIPESDFHLIPSQCSISSITIKCPPLTIPNKFLTGLTLDKFCINKVCSHFFKIKSPLI